MNANRRRVVQQLAVPAALTGSGAGAALAQSSGSYQTLSRPVPTDSDGQIEVIEFFHYGCPHCRDFHPLIQAWKRELPDDVAFHAIPAIWDNAQLRSLAQLYYALERSGYLDEVEAEIFTALQDEERPLFSEKDVSQWLAEFDTVDRDAVIDTYNSFAVRGLVQRADQVARAYRVQGVPQMAVAGRYITSASMSGSHENTLRVVDQLIARERTG